MTTTSPPALALPDIGDAVTDGRGFMQQLLSDVMAHLDERPPDNLDTSYPPLGVRLAPSDYDRARADYLGFLVDHRDALFDTFSLWADARSRDLFRRLLLFRALGHERIRLPSNTPAFWDAKHAAAAYAGDPSALRTTAGAEALNHYVFEAGDRTVRLDCLQANVLFTFGLRQYHLERETLRIAPALGDHVLDVGACFGDTAIGMALAVGPGGAVHAFEPLGSHLAVLHHNMAQNPGLAPIRVHAFGLSDHAREGSIADGAADPGFRVDQDATPPLRRLDDLVASGAVERVDFVKMDIEGHEEAALRGALDTLRRFRPRLAISLYHRWEDYFRIPLWLRDLDLGYRFYLENYTISDGETVLYAVADAP